MTETSKIDAVPASATAAEAECQEVVAVAKRAWRGIVTVALTVCVAVVMLGFAAAALLVSGFIPLSGLEGRISTAIEERLGPNWKVTAEHAQLDRLDGRSRLRVREVSFRHAGGASFRAPEAVLGYDPMALLRGDIRLVSLDLTGDCLLYTSPLTAYQMVSMLEGVVNAGTATVVKSVGKPLAGKTGTTNDAKDVWFVGFSPDLAVGVYMGFDKPKSLGNSATAGQYAAPIFRDFMTVALKDKPATPFRVPPGIKLIRVDPRTGMRAGGEGGILEAFKPGTAPPDSYSVIGASDGTGGAMSVAPAGGRSVGSGTGGLY